MLLQQIDPDGLLKRNYPQTITIGPLLWRLGWKEVVELGICSTVWVYLDSGEEARGIRSVSDIKTVASKS